MNENEDLISRLRAIGRRPVDTDVAAQHLAAMADPAGAGASWPGRHRLKIVAAFAVGLLAGTSGLATAGALPNGAQEVAHRTLGAVGVKVPHGDRYWGEGCDGEKLKNHGQYVKSQPKEKRAEAAKSRCGKPVQAGSGGDSADPAAGTGCQGPPPWAGKGKPDPAAKAARKQACGDAEDGDEKKQTPAPAAEAQPATPLTPEPSPTTDPSILTTDPTTPTTEATVPAETTTTTETTATTATTTTTTPLVNTPPTAADPPAVGQG
jgi:hypothetical protein